MEPTKLQMKKLLSKNDIKQFMPIINKEFSDLSDAQLKRKITRARRQRDKYRDLARRQRLVAKRRSGSVEGAKRTLVIASIFDKFLDATQRKLKARKKPRVLKKAKRGASARARFHVEASPERRMRSSAKRASAISRASRAKRKAGHIRKTPSRRIVVHQAAAHRRQQARKDAH
ncbi:MAG TPA: hypothetical protein VM432_06490 [Bdellovibrionales bacterium]|nr:hypothetical protein [Bdellovibrionales bacterium]